MNGKNNLGKNHFSSETIKRLSVYLRNLRRLKEQGVEVISSGRLTKLLNVTPEQFRKDLSYFGGFGKRGVGYNVKKLKEEIEEILGVDKQWDVVLIGAGKLGSALLGFVGFSRFSIRIKYAFDIDEKKVGKARGGVKISSMRDMKRIIKNNNIKIAVISTPPGVAQEVASKLIDSGIKCILNFAPMILNTPEGICVSNVDMASELESLVFYAKQGNSSKGKSCCK